MPHPKIDFLKQKYDLPNSDEKPFLFFRKSLIASFFILATVGAAFSFRVHSTSEKNDHATEISLFSIIQNLVLPSNDALEGETNDRVNFLLTGIGGEGHNGPQLTDTILFGSYRPTTKKLALMSLPRDMIVSIPGHGYQKVNHVNAYAEVNDPGSGGETTAQFIGNVLDQPIEYYMRVDFNGFAELIDTIGGVDVSVDHPFTDPAYPIIGKELDPCGNTKASMNLGNTQAGVTNERTEGTFGFVDEQATSPSGPKIPAPDYRCRFEALTFKKGTMHMNGKTALAFVRSRHGNNGEGSDFARSHRQQKIMLAVKDKIFSASTFLNPVRLTGIFETLQNNISTNLSVSQLMRLGKELRDLQSEDVVNHVIDDSPNSPLYSTMLNGAYVLLPKNDDWTTLQKMAHYNFTLEPRDTQQTKLVETPTIPVPVVRIEIQNGTNLTGLGVRASQLLGTHSEFDVIKVGNAVTRDYDHTVIYDLTNGAKTNELKTLQTFFQAEIASASGWMKNGEVVPKQVAVTPDEPKPIATAAKVDFLVILGQSARDVVMK